MSYLLTPDDLLTPVKIRDVYKLSVGDTFWTNGFYSIDDLVGYACIILDKFEHSYFVCCTNTRNFGKFRKLYIDISSLESGVEELLPSSITSYKDILMKEFLKYTSAKEHQLEYMLL